MTAFRIPGRKDGVGRRESSPGNQTSCAKVLGWLAGWFVALGLMAPPTMRAQEAAADSQLASDLETNPASDLTVGILGRYRLGHWTRVQVSESVRSRIGANATIETLDGDGVPVRFEQADLKRTGLGYAIAGSEAAELRLIADDQTIVNTRFPTLGAPVREASLVPSSMRWFVVIGDPLGADQIGANDLLGREAEIAISQIRDAKDLPQRALGFGGVDLVMINSGGLDLLSAMTADQRAAIVDWVQNDGGQIFVCLGESGPQLLDAAPWLKELIPLDENVATVELDPSALETFTSSQSQLSTFQGLRLVRDRGQAKISGRTKRRVIARFAVRYLSGFGEVTVIAADLDQAPFSSWPDRMALLARLNPRMFSVKEDAAQVGKRNTAFDDLAGQARATLDQFPSKRPFQFSVLSLVMMGLILLIGPLDYWLVNRVVGRPLLGWLTLPVVIFAFSIFLTMHAREDLATRNGANEEQLSQTRTASVQGNTAPEQGTEPSETISLNRIEITDIDTLQGVGRGLAWGIFYSHPGGRFDVDVQPSRLFPASNASTRNMLTRPFGHAGQAYGGIQIEMDNGLPAYRTTLKQGNLLLSSMVDGIPVPPRSSKSLATNFSFEFELEEPVQVVRRRGGDALQTGLRNPLNVDVLDGMLIYRNWIYYLPTRFRPGQEIESLEALRQRNFRWHLTRQKATESNSDSLPWNPEDFSDPMRVAEMLMFHEVVGGRRYTGLNHAVLGDLDMTELLAGDRCVLLGRLADPFTDISIQPSSPSTDDRQDSNSDESAVSDDSSSRGSSFVGHEISLVRVVLPVVDP